MANRKVTQAVKLALLSAGAVSAGLYGVVSAAQEQLTEVIVTGSRIVNPNLESASQVLVVDSKEIALQQVGSAEALLRTIPGVVPSIGPGVNNGNNGTQLVDLRNLGPNRNVVMLDSHRIVPYGLTGVADLNNIPLSLIERVDVVSGGASSVYGADAIAGVVNFITKRDFQGVDVSANYSVSEESDGEIVRTDIVLGGNFGDGRGNAVIALGYLDSKSVLQGDRPFGANTISSVTGGAGGSSAGAPTVVSAPGLFGQFNPTTGTIDPGFTPYNFAPLNIFQTPVERFNIFGKAHYGVTDSIEVYGSGMFTKSRIVSQIAPSATFFNTYRLPISNPFLPTPSRNQICAAYGIAAADCAAAAATTDANDPAYREVSIGLRRRFVEAGPRTTTFENDAFQFVGGIRGDLPANWNWDLSTQYGESNQVSTIGSFGLFSRAQQALRAVSTTECSNPTAGCVPLNLFGPIGSLTSEMFNFLDAGSSTRTDTSLAVMNLTFTGDMGDIKFPWANDAIGVAVGTEYREYIASSAGDFLGAQPGELLGAGGADPAVSGKYDVAEAYLEFLAPIVTDAAWAKTLTLEAGVRYSDYSTTSGSTTWKAGGTWEVNDSVTVRAVFQSAVRSPNISELFFPVQTVLDNFASDPCAGTAPVGNAALRAICLAQGAPASIIGLIQTPAAGQVNVTTGGNPDLDTEDADTFTIGFIFRPAAVPNLTLTIDYFDVKLEKAITSPEVGDIIDGCFDSDFNPGLTFNTACANIVRNSVDGSLNGSPADTQGVILQLSNLGKLESSGIDFGVSYGWDWTDRGSFNWALNSTYTFESKFQATPVSEDRDCLGFYSTNCGNIQPELAVSQRLTWSYDKFDVSLRHRFIDSVSIEPAFKGEFLPAFESISSRNYFDLTLRGQVMESISVTLNVNNLFDEKPPEVGNDIGPTTFNSGNTYPTVYDAIGRTYAVGVNVKF